MLIIQRTVDWDDWERLAVYRDNRFFGRDDFVDGFRIMEGWSEQEILDSLDGPEVYAVRLDPDDYEEQSIPETVDLFKESTSEDPMTRLIDRMQKAEEQQDPDEEGMDRVYVADVDAVPEEKEIFHTRKGRTFYLVQSDTSADGSQ